MDPFSSESVKASTVKLLALAGVNFFVTISPSRLLETQTPASELQSIPYDIKIDGESAAFPFNITFSR